MPSGAKKRKAAKKKKVHNSTSTNPHQGEDVGGDQNPQDPSVEVENKETNGDQSNIEIETGAKSKSSNGSSSSSNSSSDDESNEKKEVVIESESAPVESLPPPESDVSPIVDETEVEEETKELVTPDEPSPETVPDKVEEEDSEVSAIVDPVDSSLQEVVKVYDETKNEEREELVVIETPEVVEEPIVVSEVGLKDSVDESVSKESGALNLSTPPEGLGSETDRADETDTVEHSDRKAVVASRPIEERQMASWKNCCGIFELFSGSGR